MNRFFRTMRIRTQLMVMFLLITVINLAVLAVAFVDMNNMAGTSNDLYNVVILPLDYVSQSSMLIEKVKTDGRATLLVKDAAVRVEMVNGILDDVETIRQNMALFGDTIKIEEAKPVHAELMETLDRYTILLQEFLIIASEDFYYINNQDIAIKYLEETLSPVSSQCLEMTKQLNTFRMGLAYDMITEAISSSKRSVYTTGGFTVAAIVFALLLSYYFSGLLSKPLMRGVSIVSKAVEGDFSVVLPMESDSEIGQLFKAFNSLLEYNRQTLATILNTSKTMRDSAENMLKISTFMSNNSRGLNEQTSVVSSAVEQFSISMMQSSESMSTASKNITAVASSIEEINSTISAVASASSETSVRVDQSSALVESIKNSITMASGSSALVSDTFNSVAASFNNINESIMAIIKHCSDAMVQMKDAGERADRANSVIKDLEVASKQIGKIVNIISDIADQTNMLALNAAIEAAGAGEAGKGFMVVANEVKELAKQTVEATEDISDQIDNIKSNMPMAVSAVSEITGIVNGLNTFMTTLTQEVRQQGKRTDQIADESVTAARRMNEISAELSKISENAQSVTKTVAESTKGVNEIAKSNAELVVGTQEIAMNSERASNNISVINHASHEMSSGLLEISKNIQLINKEAAAVQESASQTNRASEELLDAALEMEKFVSRFKLN